jgi:hypothetical protein
LFWSIDWVWLHFKPAGSCSIASIVPILRWDSPSPPHHPAAPAIGSFPSSKVQGAGVALILLRKGEGAQHAPAATDDATDHRAQQQPPRKSFVGSLRHPRGLLVAHEEILNFYTTLYNII